MMGLIMANSEHIRLNIPPGLPQAPATVRQIAEQQKADAGSIKWHAHFAAAQQAAHESNKPILLFQMMGRLSDKFC
jgi:hypothetical protein